MWYNSAQEMRKIIVLLFATCVGTLSVFAEQRPNPRGVTAVAIKTSDVTDRNTKEREERAETEKNSRLNRGTSSRGVMISDTNTMVKAVAARSAATTTARTATVSRSAAPIIRANATAKTSTAARAVVRSATINAIAKGTNIPVAASRGRAAALPTSARATAIFTNVGALGSDYSQCREAYFSCMDQFCGLKSDTYRRCLCSNKFKTYKDRESAYTQAKQLIIQFNDNNLNAVDKSAAEVGAMYSATSGEAALKTDASASAQMLTQITDLLSGKVKATEEKKEILPITLDLDFSSTTADIWGNTTEPGGVFGNNSRTSSSTNIDELEGAELYNAVNQQCLDAVSACNTNQATKNMIQSAYSVLISQDCSTYEKSLDGQKSAIETTLRQANVALMDARLDEFRTHNSASVNDCISKVRQSMLNEYACGPNWIHCLDFSGLYINTTTGEPIYTPQLFKLADSINLNNLNDSDNQTFMDNLDKMRNRATEALDTCRDEADNVWDAFKQQALIEISQAQDDKINDVKDNCVDIMTQCYDKQAGALNAFGQVQATEEQSASVSGISSSLGLRAASAMCTDQVLACAALYGDPDGCSIDNNGRVSDASGKKCGLQALLAFVSTVDTTKVEMACKQDLQTYITGLCTPQGGASNTTITATSLPCIDSDGNGACSDVEKEAYAEQIAAQDEQTRRNSFPYACLNYPLGGAGSIYEMLAKRAALSCIDPAATVKSFDLNTRQAINDIMRDMRDKMGLILKTECSKNNNGIWISDMNVSESPISVITEFANGVYQSLDNFLKLVPSDVGVYFVENDASTSVQKDNYSMAGLLNALSSANVKDVNGSAVAPESLDLAARGWGYCAAPTAQARCNHLNTMLGIKVANYNAASLSCDRTTQYYQVVCTTVLDGTWNEQSGECTWNHGS